MMFWSRPLFAAENDFIQAHFGHSLDSLAPRFRLYVRRIGDRRRALSMNGGRIFLPASFFHRSDPRQPLRLAHPVVAGIFAHELLHQWQRQRGRAVTREAIWLQLKATCLRGNPYHYLRCTTPEAMLNGFLQASVEQQGQIWEDHVHAAVLGAHLPCMALVAAHVRGIQSEAGFKVAINS
jgi:hypothetical protein